MEEVMHTSAGAVLAGLLGASCKESVLVHRHSVFHDNIHSLPHSKSLLCFFREMLSSIRSPIHPPKE